MKQTYGAIFFSLVMLPSAAMAQEGPPAGGCQNRGLNVCLAGGAARLSAASGEVLLSRGAGFAQIGAGEGLSAGDRLLVKKGNATLALGPSCRTILGVNSMVTITQADGVTCASPVSADPSTAGADLPSRRAPPPPVLPVEPVAVAPFGLAPLAVGAGIVGIGVATAVLANQGRDRGFLFAPPLQAPPLVTPPPFVPVVETPPPFVPVVEIPPGAGGCISATGAPPCVD